MNQIDKKFYELINSTKYKEIINEIYKNKNALPDKTNIFKAFELCPLSQTKVIILGQDPYYTKGLADGLAFSTHSSKRPKTLQNIFLEIQREYPNSIFETNNLENWAKQGILLLNNTLTVEIDKPLSHKKYWKDFTKEIIELINRYKKNVIFVLWGNEAMKVMPYIKNYHFILSSSHPSPLSANKSFFGNNHFILINKYLKEINEKEIKWSLYKNNKI